MISPMTDKITKLLLLAIALGLWANFAASFFHPQPVKAFDLDDLTSDVHKIARGTCSNAKIC